MQRREFLGRIIGSSLTLSSLAGSVKGDEAGNEERIRKFLRSIMPSRQRVEDFFTAWAIKDKVVEWLEPKPRPYG